MDDRSFDRFTRLFSSIGSRRDAVRMAIGAALLGIPPGTAEASKREKGRKARRNRSARLSAQAVPASCCSSGDCNPGPGKNLSKCCYDNQDLEGKNFKGANLSNTGFRGSNLTGANLSSANLGKTCFVGANLTSAKLGGTNTSTAIFCGTTMPDGTTINNSGCNKPTSCCSTCAGECPPDPSNNQPGFCCAGGFCSCGGTCDCGPDCFIITTTTTQGSDEPIVRSREVCEPPAGCAICQGREDRCCTACVGDNEECASSGPISGGSIRRR